MRLLFRTPTFITILSVALILNSAATVIAVVIAAIVAVLSFASHLVSLLEISHDFVSELPSLAKPEALQLSCNAQLHRW
jgi:hypothetical protein